jgi:cytochrome c556
MIRIVSSALAVSAVVVALGWGVVSVSAQDKEAAVMDRRDTMKAQAAAMGKIKDFLDGKIDQAAANQAADDLVKIANSLPDKFPKGTSTEDFPGKSGAKPIIWSDWDKFVAAQKQEAGEIVKLNAAVKSGDKKAVADQFANTGKDGCGNCHGTYRLKLS